ncbi:hypothetical protein PROFUN_07141 [Planoprotostelium fungivorum]|uniref:Serine aminopeptidase S33 domain-containing protein n=1 Tax=Planoprotostelium fungivorum TaxID=1890364 RepID=A0A2P6NMK2_9EUKA|nr:hypothetical protein PROFUN_07141 [Planoprotostelium fungivorum]
MRDDSVLKFFLSCTAFTKSIVILSSLSRQSYRRGGVNDWEMKMQAQGLPFGFPTPTLSKDEIFVFLHGFTVDGLSGGGSMIASAASMMLGIPIEQPNLNYPTFEEYSITNALTVVDRLWQQKVAQNPQVKFCLIGASMGGYIAARWAQLNPEKVKKLFLLCPAFELASKWPSLLKQEEMEQWKKTGVHSYQGNQIRYAFFEDALNKHPALPEVSCPVHLIHGKKDQIVDVQNSRNFAALHKEKNNVKMVEVEDDHSLAKSLPVLLMTAREYFLG